MYHGPDKAKSLLLTGSLNNQVAAGDVESKHIAGDEVVQALVVDIQEALRFQIRDDSMPTQIERIVALEERLRDLPDRIKALEGAAPKPNSQRSWMNPVILTAVIGGLGWWGWFVTSNVIAIKQQLSDGGNKQIVAELEKPKSPKQLQAALTTVVAQVQQTLASNKKPNVKKVETLAEAVASVIKQQPELPEAWQAAASLASLHDVSFNPSTLRPDLAAIRVSENNINCFDRPMVNKHPLDGPPPQPDATIYHKSVLHDCFLYLDDVAAFQAWDKRVSSLPPSAEPIKRVIDLDLLRVKVIYRGGSIPPDVIAINFYGCTFDIQTPTQPLPSGQLLLNALLTQGFDQSDLSVTLSQG